MSRRARDLLFLGAVGAGALGWWLPYLRHTTGAAALVLLGLDLGDFLKFTSEWRFEGLMTAQRHFFFLPPVVASAMLALWLSTKRGSVRLLMLPLLAFLALVALPALDVMMPLLLPGNPLLFEEGGAAREYTFQLWLTIAGVLVIALLPLWQRLPLRASRFLLAALGVVGALLPAYALWYVWEIVQSYYGGAAVPGFGIFITSLGFALGGLVGAFLTIRPEPHQHP